MLLRRRQRRAGAVLVETALVYPVLFLLIFGIILLGTAVFRYQQVAHAAREGARYAIVHGEKFGQENEWRGLTAATPADVYTYGIKPFAGGMAPPDLTYSVTWDQDNSRESTRVETVNGVPTVVSRQNKVVVTVTYVWNTGMFGPITVSSTCVMTMSY